MWNSIFLLFALYNHSISFYIYLIYKLTSEGSLPRIQKKNTRERKEKPEAHVRVHLCRMKHNKTTV